MLTVYFVIVEDALGRFVLDEMELLGGYLYTNSDGEMSSFLKYRGKDIYCFTKIMCFF